MEPLPTPGPPQIVVSRCDTPVAVMCSGGVEHAAWEPRCVVGIGGLVDRLGNGPWEGGMFGGGQRGGVGADISLLVAC